MPSTRTTAGPSPARQITDAIIARLEAGVSPWRRSWATAPGATRPMRACGEPYRGINALWLGLVAMERSYASPTWMTYRQAGEVGGQVRKGEKGTIAVFYKAYPARGDDAAGGEDGDRDRTRRVLKSYIVFNVTQIDGLPDRFLPAIAAPETPATDGTTTIQRAAIDALLDGSGATIVNGGHEACYQPVADVVRLPMPAAFETYALYGATAAHELVHWTGHSSRLSRDLGARFGSDAYAAEELIAELGAALIGAELGLPVDHLDDHASYVGAWLKLMKTDERALFTAAGKAEEAAAFLLRKGLVDADDLAGAPTNSVDETPPLALAA